VRCLLAISISEETPLPGGNEYSKLPRAAHSVFLSGENYSTFRGLVVLGLDLEARREVVERAVATANAWRTQDGLSDVLSGDWNRFAQ